MDLILTILNWLWWAVREHPLIVGTSPIWAFPVTWELFVFTMMLKKHRDDVGGLRNVHPAILIFGTPFVGIGLVLDLYVNLLVMTVLILEPPRFELTTSRLTRWSGRPRPSGWLSLWRWICCRWICRVLLHPFDKDHCT